MGIDSDILGQWWIVTIASVIVVCLQGFALVFRTACAQARPDVSGRGGLDGWLGHASVHHLADVLGLCTPSFRGLSRSDSRCRNPSSTLGQRARQELLTKKYIRSTRQESALEQVADVLDTPISCGDRFDLLIDGPAFFEAVLQAIANAETYIYAAFYILRDDHIGNRVANALIQRAKAGLKVRIVYDEVGCLRLSKSYLARLADAGDDVRAFHTRQGWVNRFQINFRNHRKLVVIDGRTAIVGGLNIGDEYVGESAGLGKWRDTGVLIDGPVARKVQAVFAGDYFWAARQDLPEADWDGDDSFDHQKTAKGDDSAGNAAVCATGPADVRPRATMMFAAAAGAAKERFWISTPYLVPNESSMVALHMAKSRGVDVRVLIPTEADHLGVYLAGFHYEHEFAEADIPIYRYTAGFMHQKCVLVDDELALIGSTNLDNRSLNLNFELMIAIADRDFVAEVKRMLEHDFASAIQGNAPDAATRWWYAGWDGGRAAVQPRALAGRAVAGRALKYLLAIVFFFFFLCASFSSISRRSCLNYLVLYLDNVPGLLPG